MNPKLVTKIDFKSGIKHFCGKVVFGYFEASYNHSFFERKIGSAMYKQ